MENIKSMLQDITKNVIVEPPATAPAPAPSMQLPPLKVAQRWLITSKQFTGTAEAIYYLGQLQELNFFDCDMDDAQRQIFKKELPVSPRQIPDFLSRIAVTMKQARFEAHVEDFIRDYPYNRNTHLVRDYWPKMNNEQQWLACRGALPYRRWVERKQVGWPAFVPKIPDKWLRDREYLNNWNKMQH